VQQAQVVAVARPEHDAVLAEPNRLAVAVDRRVLDVVANGHGEVFVGAPVRAGAQARSSSTSNSSVAFGGMTPPAPRAP